MLLCDGKYVFHNCFQCCFNDCAMMLMLTECHFFHKNSLLVVYYIRHALFHYTRAPPGSPAADSEEKMMASEYLTIRDSGNGEYEEKKSRFLGEAVPVSSEEEAAAYVAGVRKKYYDARHHCYAWVLGENGERKKSADDGEPSGTAGQPILKVIEGSGCTNVLVIVTRYFGGTLLGTGGLVRAYTQAARAALENTEKVRMCLCRQLEVTVEYSALDRLLYELRRQEIEMGETEYGAQVTLRLTVESARAEELIKMITALTSGGASVREVSEGFFPIAAG